jgi:hypothetical protein
MAAQLRAYGAYDPADGPEQIANKWMAEIAPVTAKLRALETSVKIVTDDKTLSRLQKENKVDGIMPEVSDAAYNSYRIAADQILAGDGSADEKFAAVAELRSTAISRMMDATGRLFTEDQLKQKMPEVFARMDFSEKVVRGEFKGKDLENLKRQTELDDLVAKRQARATMGEGLANYNAMVKELRDTISLVPEAQRSSVLTGVGQVVSEGLIVDLENFNKNIRGGAGVSNGNMAKPPEKLAKEAQEAAAEIERLSSAPITPKVAELLSYRIRSLLNDPVNGKNAVVMDNLIPVLAKPDVVRKLKEKGNLATYIDNDAYGRLEDYVTKTLNAGAAGLRAYDGQYTVSADPQGLPIFTAKPNGRITQDNLTKLQDRLHNAAKAYANLRGTEDVGSVMRDMMVKAKQGGR